MTRDKRPYLRMVKSDREEDLFAMEERPKTRLEVIINAIKKGANTRSKLYKIMKIDEGSVRSLIRQGINKGLIKEITCSECHVTKYLEVI